MKAILGAATTRFRRSWYFAIAGATIGLVSIGVFVISAEPPMMSDTQLNQLQNRKSNIAVPISTSRSTLNAAVGPDRAVESTDTPSEISAPKLDLGRDRNSNDLSVNRGWLTLERCPIFALETIELPAQDAGVIVELNVMENQLVSAGQILGRQDSQIAELEKSVAALQSQVAAAEATDASDVRLAQSFVEETQLQADIYEQMQNRGTATDGDLRQRQLAAEQAKVKLVQAQSAQKQRELKSKLAQASLFLSQRKVERLAVVAPIQGIVTRIDHHRGEWVPAGETILRIVRMDELKVDCLVDIHQVDPASLIEQPIKVTLNRRGFEGRVFSGRIASFDPDVSAGGMVRVHATVQNQREKEHWLLLPGMSVTIQMQPVR